MLVLQTMDCRGLYHTELSHNVTRLGHWPFSQRIFRVVLNSHCLFRWPMPLASFARRRHMRHASCPSATFAVRLHYVKLRHCIPASSALERDRPSGRSDSAETLQPGQLWISPRLVLRYCKAFAIVQKLSGRVSAASDQPKAWLEVDVKISKY
jgi:hypothetical protein